MEKKDLGTSSTKLEPNVAAVLCYVAGWITGLIFVLVEKENKFVRFHAMQSLILSVSVIILSLIPILNLLVIILAIPLFILWIVLMVKAYKGEQFKLPVIGDLAEKHT
ncbi:MAG: DUF4870 domain-containing protein [Candidatus Omnitrophica bacterium]|nr:DUF4870 domain-containing protein [Candidatus Omnitrophota bacterium]